MAVNQQRRAAMKRLAHDWDELIKSPVDNVSAAPLDEDMLEWHCNFICCDVIYHVILFFPENYPYKSPSAEFCPRGIGFMGGATKDGRKGVQICLSIFSDFADWHKEWADEKGMGWSPGYTVQTVLLNLVAFMADLESRGWGGSPSQTNKKLGEKFICEDCGHSYKKPYPELTKPGKAGASKTKAATKGGEEGPEIVDYISKAQFVAAKPKSSDDLYGYGLIKSGPPHRPALTTPCEFLSSSSFYGMQKSIGKCQSIMKEDLAFFLPLFIHPLHGAEIQDSIEKSMKEIAAVLPKANPKKTPIDDLLIRVIPNLMSATVVEFSKGTQHTSDNHLTGYFGLHRLFLWAIETYPEMQDKIDQKLKDFMDDENNRTKKACPHIGEWLMLLSGSEKYTWSDASTAYLTESWRRNVMWYVKDNSKLGMLDTDKEYRLDKTAAATAVSRKLLAFQVLFLDIAMPKKLSRAQIIARYDKNCGFPTAEMVVEMKEACSRIEKMKTYEDWFKVLKLPPPSDAEIYDRLIEAVRYSIMTDGYHWSFKGMAGWYPVLQKYKEGVPGWKRPPKKSKDDQKESKGASPGPSADTGKGRGQKRAADDGGARGRGRGRGRGGGAGGKKAKIEQSESEDSESEEEEPKGRGRGAAKRGGGRGRGAAKAVGRGRGAKINLKEDSESEESDSEDDEPKGRGRGRGAAKRGRGAAKVVGRGRGGKRGAKK